MRRHWLANPALSLLPLACAVCVAGSGRLTLRLLLPGLVYGSFLVLLQMMSLAVVRAGMPWRQAVALFFAGHTPWSVWVLASAALWGLFPAEAVIRYSDTWRLTALVPLAWSAWIDYRFFRKAAGRPPGDALLRLALQRAMCWIPGLLVFVAPAAWQELAGALGL